jgi:Transposase DDE domain
MFLGGVLDKFIERCPAAVMVRATVERLLRPERLDEIFERHRGRQYERKIVCSELMAMMMGVATRTHQSVHAGYLAARQKLGVSAAAVYGKLASFDPVVTAALVRETAADMSVVIRDMPRGQRVVLPGYEVFYLDGNHLAATEHRLDVLRTTREGPLPGQTLAWLDAQTELVTELVPCECGHAQERSLLPSLLERVRAETVTVADRNFCTTKFLFGLVRRGAYFVIRQHASTLTYRCQGRRRKIGRCATGTLYEQTLILTDQDATEQEDSELAIRRLTLVLDAPTQAGNREIHLLTNLPPQVRAKRIAETYRLRWTIEGAFQTMTDVLRCEVETLGYPKAALFSFAMAVLAWNAYAVVQAALRSVHGAERIDDELSDEHLVRDVVLTQTGLEIAVDPSEWEHYRDLSAARFATALAGLARKIDLSRYPKHKRGPKKPRPKQQSGSKNHHVSTAKLLARKNARKTVKAKSKTRP